MAIAKGSWIAITSRQHPESPLKKATLEVSLEKNNLQLDHDMELYLEVEMAKLSFTGDLKTEVKNTLKAKAEGVFYWINCQINVLKECAKPISVRKALQNLPPDLKQTYVQAIKKCQQGPNSTDAHNLLLWLLYTFEPLSQKQIMAMLLINMERQQVEPNYQMNIKLDKIIDSTLVSINSNGIVQLAHASVKEFLLHKYIDAQTKNLFEMNELIGHSIIAQMCITYLLQWKSTILHSDDFPLEQYAIKYWANHVEIIEQAAAAAVSSSEDSLKQLTKEILQDKSPQFLHWTRFHLGTGVSMDGSSPLYCAAFHGLIQSTASLIVGPNQVQIDEPSGELGTALSAAAYSGKKSIVEFLLMNGANPNIQHGLYGTALQAAAYRGNENIVQLLLDNGAEVNSHSGKYGNALQAACMGKQNIVKYLLKRGADINANGGEYGNALQTAAFWGNKAIVQLLLENGVNVNAQSGYPLQAAVLWGNKTIVKLLLNNGANVNIQGGKYGNALQAAALRGDKSIFKLLLEKGADVNADCGQYGNALQGAAYIGDADIVKLLLEKGANVNLKGGQYGNALQAAAFRGNQHVFELLISHGADVDAQGGEYGNALQAAALNSTENMVKDLLNYGADVGSQGGQYGNALQAASFRGNKNICKMLLVHEADVNIQGGFFGSALQAAVYKGNNDIVEFLLAHGANKY
ncbi:ankyrin repeat-containing domain protein [Lentinula edodes]|uniref:Ankyrin repeat-containing domain protein n=1 Tax=Lentinula lateritia TaxID=40482 RepID=A0A9W9A544_9AGAR|nr:ankyrin repeat-containing domain protein [Lentinula edodes]